jgi:hypothetical protein
MSESEYSFRDYLNWNEISSALDAEIIAAQDKKTEYTIYDGRRGKILNDLIVYTFHLSGEEKIDPNNITEVRYNDSPIPNATLLGIKGQKAHVGIPQDYQLPKMVRMLTIVSDPSFILKKLQEQIEGLSRRDTPQQSLLDAVFGSKKYLHAHYKEDDWKSDGVERFNERQKEAVEKAQTNPVLFIWGPPGTGKTTILGKIISDYVKQDETVLLCSNTNRAVDVSILKALEVSEHEQTPIKEKSLRWGDVFLAEEEDLQFVKLSSHIMRLREEKKAEIQEEYDLLEEYDSFGKPLNQLKEQLKPHKLQLRKLAELEAAEANGSMNDFQREQLIRIRKKLQSANLDVSGLEAQVNELSEAREKVENRIVEKYESLQALRTFVAENTRVTIREVLEDVRFQSATFARAILEEELFNQSFDNILIDEASMANLPYILFLLSRAKKRVIFVGDPQQLEPIVLSSTLNSKKWLGKDIFMHASDAASIEALFLWQSRNTDISVLLQDQYRMPEKIYQIVNKLFYKDNLRTHVKEKGVIRVFDSSQINPPLTFPSNLSGSPVNVLHAEILIKDVHQALSQPGDKRELARDIGIMVPYTQQKRFLQYQSKIRYIPDSLEIGVVHTFQGREKPLIYMDLTLSNIEYTYPTFDEAKTSVLSVSRLLNVGISRCQASESSPYKGEFVLVANYDYFKRHHSHGIVWDFLEMVREQADEFTTLDTDLDPFAPLDPFETQETMFDENEDEDTDEQEVEVVTEEPEDEVVDIPRRAKRQIEQDATRITQEIRIINGYAVKLGYGELFKKTENMEQILTDLPINICRSSEDFRAYVGMLYKLIYEATGSREAKWPIPDKFAKLGKETYGKIRLVIHQLRQFYEHDYQQWDQAAQDKLLGYVGEFFEGVGTSRGSNHPDDWIRTQLATLARVTNYLAEVKKRLAVRADPDGEKK